MKSRPINISLPSELLNRIDAQISQTYSSRSEYIRRAVLEQVRFDEANNSPEAYRDLNEARKMQLKRYTKARLKEDDQA